MSISPTHVSLSLTLALALGCAAEPESGTTGFESQGSSPGSDGSADDSDNPTTTASPTTGNNSDSADATSGVDPTADDDSSGGGAGFVDAIDAGTMSECDPWEQDCPAGDKCVPYRSPQGTTWDANRCVPVVANPKSVGEECFEMGGSQSGEDDCDATSTCNYIVDGIGVCVEMCTGSAAAPVCSANDTSCNIDNDGTRNLCTPRCDPLLQDCPDNSRMTCLIGSAGDEFTCELGWGEEGIAVGEACVFDNACLNGNFCLYVPEALPGCEGSGCCTPYCETTDDCTQPDTECLPYFDPMNVPPGFENLGYCALPG
jgi:hypothetical protein